MKARRVILFCLLPVFLALAFVGLPPPGNVQLIPNQQRQEQTLDKES